MTPFLLGLVVVATVFAAAEGTCSTCGGGVGLPDLSDVNLDLAVNLLKCPPAVQVNVGAVVLGDGLQLCLGGKVTKLAPLSLRLAVKGVVVVDVVLLGKRGKRVLKAVVKLNLVKLGVKLVGGRYPVVLDVMVDVKTKQLLFLCLGKRVHEPIDLSLDLNLLNLGLGVGVGLP